MIPAVSSSLSLYPSGSSFLSSCSLPLDTLIKPGTLFVVEELGPGIDAQFATHFLLRDFILGGQSQGQSPIQDQVQVVLVTTSQCSRHWSDIANKLGWNLEAMQKEGRLHLIDLIEQEWTRLCSFNDDDDGGGDDKVEQDKLGDKTEEGDSDNELFLSITKSLLGKREEDAAPTLIMIEDLSAILWSSKINERRLVELLLKLKCFANTKNASILTLVHSPSRSSLPCPDVEGARFAALVCQTLSDVCLTVSPLSTGTSPQISGHLRIRLNDKKDKKGRNCRYAQYKLDERNVRVTFMP